MNNSISTIFSEGQDKTFNKGILCCKICFQLHSFQIYYYKKDLEIKIKFESPCISEIYSLEIFLEKINDFYLKCSKCYKILMFEEKIYSNKEKNIFKCDKCNKNENNFELKKSIKNKDFEFINILNQIDKLYYTSTEEQKQYELFKINKNRLILLKVFTEVILYNYSYDDLTERKIICFNFLKYFEKYIEIILKYQNYYDVFSIVKEIALYGNKYEFEFGSNLFMDYYIHLIKHIVKKKILSIEIFEFIKSQYINKDQNNKYKDINFIQNNSNKEIYNNFALDIQVYNYIVNHIKQFQKEAKIINLDSEILKLNNENYLNNYYFSYFNIPSKMILKRKGINILLSKIISLNFNLFEQITPNQNMIKTIRNEINIFLKNSELSNSLIEKLKSFNEKLLNEYGYILPNWKKKNNIPLKENHPYISFNYDEINILQKIKQEKINNKQELKTDLFILQTSIDFLFFLKEKGNIISHLNEKNCLIFYNDLQKINNYRINQNSINSNLQLTIGEEIKIKDITQDFSLKEIISYVFENIDETIFDKNNKIEFILEKYNSELEKLTKSFNTLNELKQKLDIKEKEIIDSINYLISCYTENDEKLFQKYEKEFQIKNCYNNVIHYFNALFNSSIINLDEFGKNNFLLVAKFKKEIHELEKYNKFKNFESLYLNKLLHIKINEVKDIYLNEVKKINDSYIKSNSRLENLKIIQQILNNFKNFSLNVEELFKEFIKGYFLESSKKKRKLTEEKEEIIIQELNLKKIINYINTIINIYEKIDITEEESGDFLFQLFKLKIGYPL